MFRKTIQNIETARTGYNQQVPLTGYNTERHDRYPINQDEMKMGQVRGKNIGSGQFSQLKKAQQQGKTSELIIRECDVSQLNHYKKPSTSNLRQIEQHTNYYPYMGPTSTTPNSSNKKQRIQLGLNQHHRAQTYDPSYKEPLQQINYPQRQNSARQQQSSSNVSLSQYYDQQFEMLKQFVYQTYQQQAHSVKTLKTQVKSIQVQCMGQLQNFANQISKELNKQKEDIVAVNKRGIQTQRQLRHFRDGFNQFLKDNQEKIQSIVLEMNGNLHKKSKANDQFGVQLKSSSHCISGGVGTSMSMNFQNDNVSMKLYNQMSAQIQILKGQLQICKQKISLLDKDTKILQSQTKINQQKQTQPNNIQIKAKLQLQQVQKIIIEKLSQDRKKYSLNQKLQELDLKTKDLYKVYQDMDSNIKGMNAEFTRVINGTVIKKEKMLEAKLGVVEEKVNEMSDKLSAQNIQDTLRPSLLKLLQQKSSNTKFIRIRQPTQQQKQKLQTKDTQNTYMLDQQGNLLDAGGNYIVQTVQSGAKQKIKIDKNLIYLLQTNGIQIKTNS